MTARLRRTAIVLLFLFSLKMGTGLLLHEVFHRNLAGANESTAAELHLACNCIDDFSAPLHAPPEVNLTSTLDFVPAFSQVPGPVLHYYYVPLIDLRGPPAGTMMPQL
ncbi:MAG TPA: hypothetical protein VEB63_03070 [Chitinophagaceae bacterium]|nr:hypothetical protein [Chitinophagaceae bacterium]